MILNSWRWLIAVFFKLACACCLLDKFRKIDRSISIFAETRQIAYRRNMCLKSRPQFF